MPPELKIVLCAALAARAQLGALPRQLAVLGTTAPKALATHPPLSCSARQEDSQVPPISNLLMSAPNALLGLIVRGGRQLLMPCALLAISAHLVPEIAPKHLVLLEVLLVRQALTLKPIALHVLWRSTVRLAQRSQ